MLYTCNLYNIIHQLYFNKKIKIWYKEEGRDVEPSTCFKLFRVAFLLVKPPLFLLTQILVEL